jgi:hypothetical protein
VIARRLITMQGTNMVSIRPLLSVTLAASLALGFALASTPASAKKKKRQQPVEQPQPPEDSPDVTFAKSFLGKTYDDELTVEGWDEIDGGLVTPPIYVHRYLREDGTYLVLTSREVKKATQTEPASYIVADALIVPKPKPDMQFSITCVMGKDQTLNFMGEAKGSEDKEWWTDVRRAWQISPETGEIASVPPKGIRCTNAGW